MSLYRKQSSPAIIILFLIILASACKNSEISSDIITINLDEIIIKDEKLEKYTDIFDDYNVIPLKFSGDSTLMRINDITVLEDRIIEIWHNNRIFVYANVYS